MARDLGWLPQPVLVGSADADAAFWVAEAVEEVEAVLWPFDLGNVSSAVVTLVKKSPYIVVGYQKNYDSKGKNIILSKFLPNCR